MTDYYTLTPTQIVMYTTEYCSDCMRAKKFFEVNNGFRSVPTIIFPDGSILVEPGWEELKAKTSNS
jgi:mycoredoxin